MSLQRIKTKDTVIVIAGDETGKTGTDDDDVEFVILSVTHMRYSIEFNQQI